MCDNVTPYSLHDDLTLTFLPSNLIYVVSGKSYIMSIKPRPGYKKIQGQGKGIRHGKLNTHPNQTTTKGSSYKYNHF